ncbi:ribokinase [Primorskyibacter sp. 2E233]|uniref:ribokinase n=1 Tax=Primorskyibacter sp. 2E233 TaxID=3413431 RepID=UPI003BF34B3B
MSSSSVVVVVGSIHYDIFVDAPHRPGAGETVTGFSWRPKFGGKGGNQAVSVAENGVRTRLVSAVGKDDLATFAMTHLAETGVETDFISRIDGVGTGMSVAISDASGDYGAVIVSGANLALDPAVLDDERLWKDAGYLILQNEIPEAVNIAAARIGREKGVVVCLNAAPYRDMSEALLRNVDILVVNAIEAEAMCGTVVDSLSGAQVAAAKLRERFEQVIVTAGASGVAYDGSGEAGAIPGQRVTVVSTHGAGDHFIGKLISGCAQGAAFGDAVLAANLSAAGHVAGRSADAVIT